MSSFQYAVTWFYKNIILKAPWIVVICILAMVVYLGYRTKDFKLDASAETLMLEKDKDLEYARQVSERYGQHEYLFVTYTPNNGDLFEDKTLRKIGHLRDELKTLKYVTSVTTILDVPLLESPPVPLKELAKSIQTLESKNVDKSLAKRELQNSPIWGKQVVSPDMKTTALLVNLAGNSTYNDLRERRDYFRDKDNAGTLTAEEEVAYQKAVAQFDRYRADVRKATHELITGIRAIMDKYRDDAELYLGGVSMTAHDLISYVRKDIQIFGTGMAVFLIATLSFIFRGIRWVALPMLCCALSVVAMMGFLGIFGWEVTVISSNFISLQLIITMSLTIHLIVRYRELYRNHPEIPRNELVLETTSSMLTPCLYSCLTTIAGFASLVMSNIKPVITFGWMMIAGITVSLIMTFLFFPAGLIVWKKESRATGSVFSRFSLPGSLANFTEKNGRIILISSVVVYVFCIIGITRLEVENCFINYFKSNTEIHKGLELIDQKLGGTTPLDVIVNFDDSTSAPQTTAESVADKSEESDEFDEFGEFEEDASSEKYWFTADKMDVIKKVHNYLDDLPETGKVLSFGTMLKIAEKLNNGKTLDNLELAVVYSEIPEEFRGIVLDPYLSIENNETRFSVRIIDTDKSLRRNELLKRITYDLTHKLNLKKESVHLSGLMVLYNNMLQSLFRSQIMTLGAVVLILMCMFMILFRSFKISLIAIFPNLLAIFVVLGFMGWMKIPLDVMTITIAAISVGIAVDNTIHYIHRFKRIFAVEKNYLRTMHQSHRTIGNAMYYTSITIVIGFSILGLSNFIPSIYFGLLTGLAMAIALLSAMTVLPALIVLFKPLGAEE